MLARLHNLPFLLVATTRLGLEDRWTPESGRYNTLALHLEPLDDTLENAASESARSRPR